MAHIKDVQIGSTTYLIEPRIYDITSGTTAAFTAPNIDNFELATGVIVTLKMNAENAANATLKVGTTDAKNIKYKNVNITAGALKANRFYSFVYDGTSWQLIGELDTDTKNTAGSTNSESKLFLIGATNQDTNPITYSNTNVFITDGILSAKAIGINYGTDTNKVTMQWNDTDQSLDFVFN